jgi:starch synthase
MSILFCASEIYPYAKSGGLADVAASLPETLRDNKTKKLEVYSVMPLYMSVDREKFGIEFSGLSFEYYLNSVRHQFDIYVKDTYELFVYNPVLCDRLGLYDDEYGDFGDNGLRFGLFSYACIETMLRMDLRCEAIHINDWQTSLIALLAKTKYHLSQKIVLTIHNLAYQGIFDKSVVDELELDWKECYKHYALEYHDKVNLLKGGIHYSDAVTTVSPNYAAEIQTPRYGAHLDDVLRNNSYKLSGILNGISYEAFNPKTDPNLYVNYDHNALSNKTKNKAELLKALKMDENTDKALFIFIGRFTNQKGIDLLIESLELVKELDANFIILGSGEEHYNAIFRKIATWYPNVFIKIGYDESFARKLYASADFLFMPSIFEPCGLNQMICMKYGTLPIVAKTGGLADTVNDFSWYHKKENTGIGVVFEHHNILYFMQAVAKALSLYGNKKEFKKVQKYNMKVDNSWNELIKEYIKIYES